MTSLFASGTATDAYARAPTFGALPKDLEQGYDCHNVRNPENMDTIEGFGDSENPNFYASVDVSVGNGASVCAHARFGLTNSVLSEKRRKMDEARVTKEDKPMQEKKLNTYLDKFYEADESRISGAHISKIDDDNSYDTLNVMKEVKKLPGMTVGSQLFAQCCHFLKNPIAWHIFVALGDEGSRLNWLLSQINLKQEVAYDYVSI